MPFVQPVDDPARKKDNPNPKWPVPVELIEWQSAYAQKGGSRGLGWASRGGSAACAAPRSSHASPLLRWRRRGASPRRLPRVPARAGAKGVQEGFWQADWKHTQSTKCLHLLKRLREIGAAVAAGAAAQKPRVKAIVYTQARQGGCRGSEMPCQAWVMPKGGVQRGGAV